jgi:transcriptional regulator with XRE-family HTH domain
MPKKNKIETPLRKLREITGKTQAEFARLLGCSPSTIKQIEAGNNSKLYDSLIKSLTTVFGVSHKSILPPSTQPRECITSKPYTKEFFDDWWKNGAEQNKFHTLEDKETMVRDLEMVLAAAMRVPGRGFGGILTSYYDWLMKLMDDCHLWPHFETELNERMKKTESSPNKFQFDVALARLVREDKSRFLTEPNPLLTILVRRLWERKDRNLKKELPIKPKKLSKLEKLKAQKYEIAYTMVKTLQPETVTNAGPKLKR